VFKKPYSYTENKSYYCRGIEEFLENRFELMKDKAIAEGNSIYGEGTFSFVLAYDSETNSYRTLFSYPKREDESAVPNNVIYWNFRKPKIKKEQPELPSELENEVKEVA